MSQLPVPALANPNPLVLMGPMLASEIFSVQKKKATDTILKIDHGCNKALPQHLLFVQYSQ